MPSIRQHGYYFHPELMSAKDERRQTQQLNEMLCRYLTDDDARKIGRKLGVDWHSITRVLRLGKRMRNDVMQECQTRALANKEREANAYHPNRVREVINKLSK